MIGWVLLGVAALFFAFGGSKPGPSDLSTAPGDSGPSSTPKGYTLHGYNAATGESTDKVFAQETEARLWGQGLARSMGYPGGMAIGSYVEVKNSGGLSIMYVGSPRANHK